MSRFVQNGSIPHWLGKKTHYPRRLEAEMVRFVGEILNSVRYGPQKPPKGGNAMTS